jgi:hypothetical protein
MAVDPNEVFGPTIRPFGGWLRYGVINGTTVNVTSANLQGNNNFSYTLYAVTPPTGPRQKVMHARGTAETVVSMSGELTQEGGAIASLLGSNARGVGFGVTVSQGNLADSVSSCILESFSLSGSPNGNITYSLTARSNVPVGSGPPVISTRHHPVPSWSSGNGLITAWSISHSVSLSAHYRNDQNPFPAYFRSGESEHEFQIATVQEFREYDEISLGIAGMLMVSGVVTSRAVDYSGKAGEPKIFNVNLTNVDINADSQSTGAIVSGGGSPDGWPSGT